MDFDLFKPKAPPLFGLDISSSSVKMLEIVEAGRGAYRVEHYAIEPLIRDTVVDGNISNLEQAADAVKRAHKRLGTRTRHVAMAVPTGAVITKKIVVAAGLREDELEIQVESEANRSEEHTSELQSPCNLVCRLLLEKKKKKTRMNTY